MSALVDVRNRRLRHQENIHSNIACMKSWSTSYKILASEQIDRDTHEQISVLERIVYGWSNSNAGQAEAKNYYPR